MNRYTIYCTPEQTKKALELGAPIQLWIGFEATHIPTGSFIENNVLYFIPTAEQMIGWLEEQPSIVTIGVNKSRCLKWEYFITKPCYNEIDNAYNYSSRKEAAHEAIDAALEYLSNNKGDKV